MNSPSPISRLTSSTALTSPGKTFETWSRLTPDDRHAAAPPSTDGCPSLSQLRRLKRSRPTRRTPSSDAPPRAPAVTVTDARLDEVVRRAADEHLNRARLDDVREPPVVEAELRDGDTERDRPRLAGSELDAREALELQYRPRDARLRIADIELHDLVSRPATRVGERRRRRRSRRPVPTVCSSDARTGELERRVAEPVTERVERAAQTGRRSHPPVGSGRPTPCERRRRGSALPSAGTRSGASRRG